MFTLEVIPVLGDLSLDQGRIYLPIFIYIHRWIFHRVSSWKDFILNHSYLKTVIYLCEGKRNYLLENSMEAESNWVIHVNFYDIFIIFFTFLDRERK